MECTLGNGAQKGYISRKCDGIGAGVCCKRLTASPWKVRFISLISVQFIGNCGLLLNMRQRTHSTPSQNFNRFGALGGFLISGRRSRFSHAKARREVENILAVVSGNISVFLRFFENVLFRQ